MIDQKAGKSFFPVPPADPPLPIPVPASSCWYCRPGRDNRQPTQSKAEKITRTMASSAFVHQHSWKMLKGLIWLSRARNAVAGARFRFAPHTHTHTHTRARAHTHTIQPTPIHQPLLCPRSPLTWPIHSTTPRSASATASAAINSS